MYEKKIYNPGFVAHYQKPWYHGSDYVGQFAEPGYPNHVHMDFNPLRKLVKQIEDPYLRDKMMTMIEEMSDACHACRGEWMNCLPSAD